MVAPDVFPEGMHIVPNASLADFTTFKLGGPCETLIECSRPDEMIKTVQFLWNSKTPFIIIGAGSNIVASSEILKVTVVRYLTASPLIETDGDLLTVSGSTLFDDAALFSVEHGLGGFVFASGIPGTVGGAIVGNAGAWGKQIGDILVHAQIITPQGEVKNVDREYFAFSYRHSILKETRDTLLNATFQLSYADQISLAKERAEILKERQKKHPDLEQYPCAGSFFRNIEPTSQAQRRQAAGWFLEQAGGKQLRCGGAFIFPGHANIIVKGDQCTAKDVYFLHEEMKRIVKEKFGIDLVREVRFLGKINLDENIGSEGFW